SRFAERARFAPDAPLIRRRLLTLIPDPGQTQPPLLAHYAKLDDAVVRLLFGQGGLDGRLASCTRLLTPVPERRPDALANDLTRALAALAAASRQQNRPLRLYFEGAAGAEQTRAATAVARAGGSRLLVAD